MFLTFSSGKSRANLKAPNNNKFTTNKVYKKINLFNNKLIVHLFDEISIYSAQKPY